MKTLNSLVLGTLALGYCCTALAVNPPKVADPNIMHSNYEMFHGDLKQEETKGKNAELTRKIRKDLEADKTLSAQAKNITIHVNDDEVDLKGPVNTQAERNHIASLVRDSVPDKAIRNDLKVSAPRMPASTNDEDGSDDSQD